MAAKIIAAILTLLIDGAVTVFVLFMMLLAMNGFSESDATPGLITYLVLSTGMALLMAVAAFFISGKFIKRELNPAVAALLAVLITTFMSIIGIVVFCFIGIGVADYVRVNY